MRATHARKRSAVGDFSPVEFGGRNVLGRIVEDLGPIGVRGRRLLRVETYLPSEELLTLDVPAEELPPQKCHGHLNGFHHFDPGLRSLEQYDLGIKVTDNDSPPPPGSTSEPGLYVSVSVKELESRRDYESITYARSRTYLRDGFPSSDLDRRRLVAAIIERLEGDVGQLVVGDLQTSEDEPIFLYRA